MEITAFVGPLLASALLIGFVGSVHCLAMCGGISAALGQLVPSESTGQGLLRTSLYSVGRVTSYAIAGAAVGTVGQAFAGSVGVTVFTRAMTALMILAMGLQVGGWWNGLALVERLGAVVWRRLAPISRRIGPPDRTWKILAVGFIWGWLPCGLVYTALVGASTTGNAFLGALFMACFGLGTLPALLASAGFGARLGGFLALREARRTAGGMLLIFGCWSLFGALLPLQAAHAMH